MASFSAIDGIGRGIDHDVPQGRLAPNQVEKLIEYRTVRYAASSEASSYFTNQSVDVGLRFANPIICRMVTGFKIMSVGGSKPFGFLPGETMLIPANMGIDIAFPDADLTNPTECLCIEIDRDQITGILERVNHARAKTGQRSPVDIDWSGFALYRREGPVEAQFQKLIGLFAEDHSEFRDVLIDANLDELVIRMLQAQARRLLVERPGEAPDGPLERVAALIQGNLHTRYSTEELAQLACMSPSTFFRHFKAHFGVTPARFANEERVRRAREALSHRQISISALAFDLGFTNAGHFIKVFRRHTGQTPGDYRRSIA